MIDKSRPSVISAKLPFRRGSLSRFCYLSRLLSLSLSLSVSFSPSFSSFFLVLSPSADHNSPRRNAACRFCLFRLSPSRFSISRSLSAAEFANFSLEPPYRASSWTKERERARVSKGREARTNEGHTQLVLRPNNVPILRGYKINWIYQTREREREREHHENARNPRTSKRNSCLAPVLLRAWKYSWFLSLPFVPPTFYLRHLDARQRSRAPKPMENAPSSFHLIHQIQQQPKNKQKCWIADT